MSSEDDGADSAEYELLPVAAAQPLQGQKLERFGSEGLKELVKQPVLSCYGPTSASISVQH